MQELQQRERPQRLSALERFLSKVLIDDAGCWIWQGEINQAVGGYGYFKLEGKKRLAHRVSVEMHSGRTIEPGLEVDHLCFVTACVNPAHLEVVTPEENIERARKAGRLSLPNRTNPNVIKTQCKRGHPFSGTNLRVTTSGARQCKTCCAMHSRKYRRSVTG